MRTAEAGFRISNLTNSLSNCLCVGGIFVKASFYKTEYMLMCTLGAGNMANISYHNTYRYNQVTRYLFANKISAKK